MRLKEEVLQGSYSPLNKRGDGVASANQQQAGIINQVGVIYTGKVVDRSDRVQGCWGSELFMRL
jgi:hypothetical protein